MDHAKSVGQDCAKRARKKHGEGWRYLSEEQQKGAVAVEVVSVLLAQSLVNANSVGTLEFCQNVARSALYPVEEQ